MKGQRTLSKIEPSLSTQHLRGSQPFSFFSSFIFVGSLFKSRRESQNRPGMCALCSLHNSLTCCLPSKRDGSFLQSALRQTLEPQIVIGIIKCRLPQ